MSVAGEIACPSCGELTPAAGRFCINCATPVAQTCPSCGAAIAPAARFCMQCAAPVAGASAAATSIPTVPLETVSERRLVSVMFADLVGFTTLSERRDPEEVRDLLSRYFDRCRSLIERYGGTVEKFIGDAVMAVWGSPVAREDDAERAVRAALALTQAVSLLGEEVEMPGLRLRAGVLTGSAAVEVGAEGEGMVLGDTVNTASRLQSIAAPGTVLVDDVTRRASEAAIAYEDAGEHQVKGREQSVHAWTALRVVAGVGGVRRSVGLEAPFVGRARELEIVTAASEEAASTHRARLVTVVGEAGAGKSRLLWEFVKYIDGVERVVRWHQGRCLSYGDGVAYWALAEMVRARAGITEEEDPAEGRTKLRAAVERFVSDERERRLVEPRLAHLLGLEHRTASDRADLFSGWRLFFERLSEDAPVILAFEDLQWADSGLLDFIDYLLEWSAEFPIFALALGRAELLEARPAWREQAIVLGPLDEAAMREALGGLVPGLPEELTERVLQRAEGVPLYAVETVRMLLDRGLLRQEGSRYVLTRDPGELEVPETLHALAAARLDSLSPRERGVLQDASVYGQSFTSAAVAAIGGRSPEEATSVLDGLVVKQILGFDDDPLSAERGQYHFLQGLLRTTAYGTLSRRDRKHRHLAAARHLQEAWGDDAPELAEVLAAHFLDAAAADPEAADAPRIRASARETLADAGTRALSLALAGQAQSYFDRAAELTDADAQRATLLYQAGRAALLTNDHDAARARLERAGAIFDELGDRESAARALSATAQALFQQDRLEEAIELNRRALVGLPDGTAEKAAALAALANLLAYRGDFDQSLAMADAALTIAEALEDFETVVRAFSTIALVRRQQARLQEGTALLERSLVLALERDHTFEAQRMFNNLGDMLLQQDRFGEALELFGRGLELAKSRGDRAYEEIVTMNITTANVAAGRWDSLPPIEPDGLPAVRIELARRGYLASLARVQAARGDAEALRRTLVVSTQAHDSSNVEYAPGPSVAQAIALRALGEEARALEVALPIATGGTEIANEDRREAYIEAGLAALGTGDEATAQQLIDFVGDLPPARRSPLLRSGAKRFEGLLAARRGDAQGADRRLDEAVRALDQVEAPFTLAQILLERAEVLSAADRHDEALALLTEARSIFERLRATPWIERADALLTAVAA